MTSPYLSTCVCQPLPEKALGHTGELRGISGGQTLERDCTPENNYLKISRLLKVATEASTEKTYRSPRQVQLEKALHSQLRELAMKSFQLNPVALSPAETREKSYAATPDRDM